MEVLQRTWKIGIYSMISVISKLVFVVLKRAVKDQFKTWTEKFSLLKFKNFPDQKLLWWKKDEMFQDKMRLFKRESTTLSEKSCTQVFIRKEYKRSKLLWHMEAGTSKYQTITIDEHPLRIQENQWISSDIVLIPIISIKN